ncbi:MAG: 4Fe-4S dicluster domain-containing protein [bacterium]|nr:4Fe-4S dicluster domain-containing protein [bacterium]
MNINNSIQEKAKELLAKNSVGVVVGFSKGTINNKSTPFFARTPVEAEKLICDSNCTQNLATYLHTIERKGKIGILARGCEARSVLTLIKEKQLNREDVYIIGIPCQGVAENGELHSSCKICTSKNPVIYDDLASEKVEDQEVDRFEEVNLFEGQSSDERWSFFENEVSKCIRCYACRNACPSCYCPSCFVDQSQPSWFGKTNNLSDTSVFHIVRALHMAGRCVDCGACSRSCPMGVNLRKLTLKMEKEVLERFNYTTGMNLEEAAPLASFSAEDNEDYMREE